MKKQNDKKIKIKPARHESFEDTLERYGQGKLFKMDYKEENKKKTGKFSGLIFYF